MIGINKLAGTILQQEHPGQRVSVALDNTRCSAVGNTHQIQQVLSIRTPLVVVYRTKFLSRPFSWFI